MKGDAVGRTACSLPWLCPSAEALWTLADTAPDLSVLESDLGFCAHLARFARPSLTATERPFSKQIILQPSLAGGAATLLQSLQHKKQLRHGHLPAVMQKQLDAAVERAESQSKSTGHLPEGMAGFVVRLSALSWAALAAVNPELVEQCFTDPMHHDDPAVVERSYFGFDHQAVLRRLVTSWRFPHWLAATLTSFHLPTKDAERLGAHIELVQMLSSIGPVFGFDRASSTAKKSTVDTPTREVLMLTARMLRNAAETRRRTAESTLIAAEERIDELTELLSELRAEFEYELRDAKLAGLAEFAAGAGHEINNPLTIISGNTQLILAKEQDPGKQKALLAIIRQTKRIHDILQGTRQFARPPLPSKEKIDLARWLPAVVASYEPEADPKGLSLTLDSNSIDRHWTVDADALQLRQILGNLIRNGIDAAPRGGWVAVSVEATHRLFRITIEDNGEGPKADQLEHLFDPFFSGRNAGRGRGIGLSIAWRLAQLNGGDVRYCRTTEGPTRFVLSLPREATTLPMQAKSA